MNKEKKSKNPKRNRAFIDAFNYLCLKDVVKDREGLAKLIKRSKESTARLLRGETSVTDDVIRNLQEASKYVFNSDFLRGESTIMLAKDVSDGPVSGGKDTTPPDVAALFAAATAAKDETIAALRSQIADKDEIIVLKNALIATLQQQLDELRLTTAIEKGVSAGTSPSAKPEKKRRQQAL